MINVPFIHALALAGVVTLAHGCARQGATETSTTPGASSAEAEGGEAGITTRELTYRTDETELEGFIAYPAGTDKRPGVLVVHEWWGLNDYARSRARQLAELGYVALAVDMYGNGRSSQHPEDARKLMNEMMSSREEAAVRFEAAKRALERDPRVDASKIAAIGYCMGGAIVLHMARKGADLDAVASFHGNYATGTPLQRGVFDGRIFIAHGGADTFTTPEQLEAIKRELDEAGATYEFVIYEGAKHGFTNPGATELGKRHGMDIAYDPAADAQSWAKLQEVLREAFANE